MSEVIIRTKDNPFYVFHKEIVDLEIQRGSTNTDHLFPPYTVIIKDKERASYQFDPSTGIFSADRSDDEAYSAQLAKDQESLASDPEFKKPDITYYLRIPHIIEVKNIVDFPKYISNIIEQNNL